MEIILAAVDDVVAGLTVFLVVVVVDVVGVVVVVVVVVVIVVVVVVVVVVIVLVAAAVVVGFLMFVYFTEITIPLPIMSSSLSKFIKISELEPVITKGILNLFPDSKNIRSLLLLGPSNTDK